MPSTVHHTDIGPLYLEATAAGLSRCAFAPHPDAPEAGTSAVLDLAVEELDAYLAGELTTFTVPVDLSAAPEFDRRVLAGLADVGHDETISYGALATKVGLDTGEARKVGGAMARNPVAIVVPCHRVVGADGALTGYAGGLPLKRRLLDLEAGHEAQRSWTHRTRDRAPQLF